MSWTMMIIVMIFIFFVERRLWARLQQLQASLFKLPTGSYNLWTRFLTKNHNNSEDFCFHSVNYWLFGTRTIWHCRQFDTGQFVIAVDNLTPQQFGNPVNKKKFLQQEYLALGGLGTRHLFWTEILKHLPQANTSLGALTTATWRRSTRSTTTHKKNIAMHWKALECKYSQKCSLGL